MTALVELAIEDGVAVVTLNRPEVRNAINDAMRAEFVSPCWSASTRTRPCAPWCSPARASRSAPAATLPA